MSNVVFILGAGASKQAGAPLMNDFLDKANDLYKLGSIPNNQEAFSKVFKAISKLQSVHSKSQLDLNNIESIFSALEMSNILQKLPSFETKDIPTIISSLKELIVTTIEKSMLFPASNGSLGAPEPYVDFIRLVENLIHNATPIRECSLITFNYDVALEVALDKMILPCDYFMTEESKGLPLLKLHGSLNWGFCLNCNLIQPFTIEEYVNKFQIGQEKLVEVAIGSTMRMNYCKKCFKQFEPTPVIIPPTWNKIEQQKSLTNVWKRAAKELSEAEYVFIIGYSLPETDVFFKLLFALGTVGDVPFRKLVVFNPDKSGLIEKRYKDILGPGSLSRFHYEPIPFNEAIPIIRKYFWHN